MFEIFKSPARLLFLANRYKRNCLIISDSLIKLYLLGLFGLAGGPTKAYKEMVKKPHLRKYYAKCLCKLQIEFVKSRPCRVKDLIRLIKYWNKTEGVCIVKNP